MRQIVVFVVVAAICIPAFSMAPSAAKPRLKTRKARSAKSQQAAKAQPSTAKVKVAEGRFELRKKDGDSLQSFEEPWTLYKTAAGLDLEEQWVARKPDQPPAIINLRAAFAPGLYPLQVLIAGAGGESQIDCTMALTQFSCNGAGQTAKLEVSGNYNFFLPSPWMMGGIARRGRKQSSGAVTIKLVQMAGMSAAGPKLVSFDAQVLYVGEDQLVVSGEKFAASIFEVRSPENMPSMLVWVSPEGLVLALEDSSKPQVRMELVTFKRYGKF